MVLADSPLGTGPSRTGQETNGSRPPYRKGVCRPADLGTNVLGVFFFRGEIDGLRTQRKRECKWRLSRAVLSFRFPKRDGPGLSAQRHEVAFSKGSRGWI